MKLAELLKKYRIDNGLTMDDLAKSSGLSKAYISMLEKNENSRNGKPITPSIRTLKSLAKGMNITIDLLLKQMDSSENITLNINTPPLPQGVKIPVLGTVAAGIPITAVSDIEDYEEITQEMARQGEFFALKIKGDSMSPLIRDENIVIVRKQAYIDTGDVAVVLVNGDEATVKEIKKTKEGITLIGWNPSVYTPKFYSKEEIEKLPVDIVGKVVESRAKF